MNLTTFVKIKLLNVNCTNMKNKQIFSLCNLKSLKLMVVILLLTLPLSGFSQDFKLMQTDHYLKSLESASETTTHDRVLSLMKDNHPSIYLESGQSKVYGKGMPVCLFTDTKSISAIRSLRNTSNIEIVTIRINSKAELSQTIPNNVFTSLDGVRYIHIIVTFDIRGTELNNFIKTESNAPYTVFYSVEKPS